jgi:hypothetical protein
VKFILFLNWRCFVIGHLLLVLITLGIFECAGALNIAYACDYQTYMDTSGCARPPKEEPAVCKIFYSRCGNPSSNLKPSSAGPGGDTSTARPPTSATAVTSEKAAVDQSNGGVVKAIDTKEKINSNRVFADQIANEEIAAAQRKVQAEAEAQARARAQAQTQSNSSASQLRPLPDVLRDGQLVQQFSDRYENGKPVTKQEAALALDPDIRRDLMTVAESQEIQKKLEREDKRLDETIKALTGMAALAAQRASSLDSVKSGDPSLLKNPDAAKGKSSSNLTASNAKLGDDVDGKNKKVGEDGKGEVSAEDAKKLAELIALGKAPKGSRLREKLRQRMEQARLAAQEQKKAGTEAVGAADHFGGKLSSEISAAGAEDKNGKAPTMGAQVVDEMLKSPGDRFSLAGPETDAKVKQAVGEVERDLATANDPSIQGADSLSLFVRVKAAHKNYLKQGRVGSKI